MTDYYKLLGVSKTATDDEIKSAYKKQALKHHPDRNRDNAKAATEKFKLVSEAYEVLSDKDKRQIYDQYGEAGLKGMPTGDGSGGSGGPSFGGFSPGGGTFRFSSSNGGGFSDPMDLFSRLFGNAAAHDGNSDDDSPFGGGGMHGGMPFGNMFGGFGGMPGMSMGGMPGGMHGGMGGMGGGARSANRPKVPSVTIPLKLTLEEMYSGCVKKLKITRNRLDENGNLKPTEKVLEIKVAPGWKAGVKITFEDEGDESKTQAAGDMIFIVEEKPHMKFKREGQNLIYTKSINLTDALCGTRFTVKGLDENGPSHEIDTSDTVVGPTTTKRVAGAGFPSTKGGPAGDLLVRFEVSFPNKLTEQQKRAVRELRL